MRVCDRNERVTCADNTLRNARQHSPCFFLITRRTHQRAHMRIATRATSARAMTFEQPYNACASTPKNKSHPVWRGRRRRQTSFAFDDDICGAHIHKCVEVRLLLRVVVPQNMPSVGGNLNYIPILRTAQQDHSFSGSSCRAE